MEPVRISTQGLSQWESVFVQTTVSLASGIEIAPCRFVEDPKSADILLVDADRGRHGAGGEADPSDRPIVVSFSADPTANGRGLARPVSYASLIAALKAAEGDLQRSVSPPAAQPDTKTADTRADDRKGAAAPAAAEHTKRLRHRADENLADKTRPARRFVEATRYIGLLKQVLRQDRPVQVLHPRYPAVLVFPDDNAFVSSADVVGAVDMFREPARTFRIHPVSASVAASALSTDRCRPLGRLVYSAALFGAEGRLVLNCSATQPLRLLDWPDFNSVPHLPEHRAVASYLLVNTADLATVAEATGVAIGVVIDFCYACEAVGLLRRIVAEDPPSPTPPERPFAQVLGRVRRLFTES